MEAEQDNIAHPHWVHSMQGFIKPYWDEFLDGPLVANCAAGTLTVREMQGWLLQIYPFIHAFPKFLAEALIKVEDDYSRSFLIDNIRVEKAHAEHWLWMGMGFGLSREEMLGLADGTKPILRDVQSLTDWLWYINTKGSLAEAVAATSFAIEGITGELARKVIQGFESYRDNPNVDMSNKTTRWMREHAKYDDDHPKVALEVVKRYATTERMQTRVMLAVKRSLQLFHQALVTIYDAYSHAQAPANDAVMDKRADDRRKFGAMPGFPDRRFRERRGVTARSRIVV